MSRSGSGTCADAMMLHTDVTANRLLSIHTSQQTVVRQRKNISDFPYSLSSSNSSFSCQLSFETYSRRTRDQQDGQRISGQYEWWKGVPVPVQHGTVLRVSV